MSVVEEELLEEISGYLHGYLKAGKVNFLPFYSKTNVNIKNLKQLLTIRFLLQNETIEFVRSLPTLLKKFNTSTVLQKDTYYGEVRGQIDWGETTKERMARNYRDKTIYSTSESVRSYTTPENLVLKELMSILYKTLYRDAYIEGFNKASWFNEWVDLREIVSHVYKKNIYLQRVDEAHVSDRLIQKTMGHRKKLYRDAASLLKNYRKLTNGSYDEEDITSILRETFIAPDNMDVLFELYWIVKLINQQTNQSELYLMDGSQNKVASWEKDNFHYTIYHDSTGSGKTKFHLKSTEIANSNNLFLKQKYHAFQIQNEIQQKVFGKMPSENLWRGRPDFLIEVKDKKSDELIKVVIGEVKNTSRIEYAITGLKELLDYIHFVKNNKDEYLFGSPVQVEGVLCLGGVSINENVITEPIRVLKRTRFKSN
ncbi:hypothetical protein ACM26V_04450 [Salipaludibacillus sp. HK11]|uniref:hypothetical protein n=1 Tax=Salipaludibacillus sp. HK11 TaxID=3394320 RepID=UPI0039FC45F9